MSFIKMMLACEKKTAHEVTFCPYLKGIKTSSEVI